MFSDVVQLYRESQRPEVKGGIFRYSGPQTPSLAACLAKVQDADAKFGRFYAEPEHEEGIVEFSWVCPANEHGRFYTDTIDLVEHATTIHRGVMPEHYYLVENDYRAGEASIPTLVASLERLCKFIQLLSTLSLVPDTVTTSTQPTVLVFVAPADADQAPRTLQLVTHIDKHCLSLPLPELDELSELVMPAGGRSLHKQEYRSLFRLAVADALVRAPGEQGSFGYLVENWPKVLAKYHFDVDCYVDNYSFDKLRLEVSRNSLDFAERLTAVMNDNAAKFLALPVPLVVLVAALKVETLGEALLLIVGALGGALLLSGSIRNQFMQLSQIDDGFRAVFKRFEGQADAQVGGIKDQIDKASRSFDERRRLLCRVLWGLQITGWASVVVALVFVSFRFDPRVRAGVLELILR